MVAPIRLLTPFAVAGILLAAGCSKEPSKQDTRRDVGPVDVECETGDDCAAGDCIQGLCRWCEETSCPAGQYCSHNGQCLGCDGGCAFDAAAASVDAGTSCASRADCAGQACVDGVCGPPGESCTKNDECAPGAICTSAGTCALGCATKQDCAGAAAGPRCNLESGQCGPCAESADCDATSENCIAGTCTAAIACPDGDRGICGELACVDKLCRPCLSGSDCGEGFDCTDGQCVGKTACATDPQCHTLSAGHWCDLASGMCKWGCLPAPACNESCCTGGLVCNTITHVCEPKACNDCDGTCIYPKKCDSTLCACVTDETKCDLQCRCSGGKTCSCGLIECKVPVCSSIGTCK